jgi:segregation and condensation protein A
LVHLQQFEGPLGLLLYLIRKEEMDIFDINVNEITRQYLDYIRMMKELDLEVAGEFVAMAATLIHIKSRMLLPQYDEQGEVVEQEDPRKELVQKLLDYQKYQEAAKQLYARPLLNRDVWARGLREDLRDEDALTAVITEDDGLFSMISAYRRVMRKAQRAVHKVRPKVQSIASRVLELKDRLVVGSRVILNDLLNVGNFGATPRQQLLITFLSMLELGRMGFVSVFQSEVYGDIYIETKKAIERNVLERVQEFDAGDAEAVARSIIDQAAEDNLALIEANAESDLQSVAIASVKMNSGEIQMLDQQLQDGIASENFLEAAGQMAVSSSDSELFSGMATDEEILAAEAELDREDQTASQEVAADFDFSAGLGADADMDLMDVNGESAESSGEAEV